MKQQIVIIHGGTTFDTYQEYISYLKTKSISLERLMASPDWKSTLSEKLGKNFEVLLPQMPNRTNARYSEWGIWFERIIPCLAKDTILIGHSLGGIFLAKYLSVNKLPKKTKAVILVSAPYNNESEESLGEFKITTSLEKFSKQVREIYLVQSKDDPVVPITELGKYKKALPNAKTIILSKGAHFNEESFPQLLKLLKSL